MLLMAMVVDDDDDGDDISMITLEQKMIDFKDRNSTE